MNRQVRESGGSNDGERHLDPGPAWRHRLLIRARRCRQVDQNPGERVEQLLTMLIGTPRSGGTHGKGEAVTMFEERLDLPRGGCGFSLVQFFASTSIAGHYVERDDDVFIDLLSCIPMPVERAHRAVRRLFMPERIDVAFQSDVY